MAVVRVAIQLQLARERGATARMIGWVFLRVELERRANHLVQQDAPAVHGMEGRDHVVWLPIASCKQFQPERCIRSIRLIAVQ